MASEDIFPRLLRQRDTVIMDMGVGYGNTGVSIIDKIITFIEHSKYKRTLRNTWRKNMYLGVLDSQDNALSTCVKRLCERDIFPHNITTIKSDYQDAAYHPLSQTLEGKVDILVSGVSFLHATDQDPLFRYAYDMVKPGGKIIVWDFGFGPCWAAPYLRIGERGHVTERTAGKIYHVYEEDLPLIFKQYENWIKFLGYDPESHGQDRGTLSSQLRKDFRSGMNSNDGFSYFEWLKRNIVGDGDSPRVSPVNKVTPYFMLDGTCHPNVYARSALDAGFKDVEWRRTKRFMRSYSHVLSKRRDEVDPTDNTDATFILTARKPMDKPYSPRNQ